MGRYSKLQYNTPLENVTPNSFADFNGFINNIRQDQAYKDQQLGNVQNSLSDPLNSIYEKVLPQDKGKVQDFFLKNNYLDSIKSFQDRIVNNPYDKKLTYDINQFKSKIDKDIRTGDISRYIYGAGVRNNQLTLLHEISKDPNKFNADPSLLKIIQQELYNSGEYNNYGSNIDVYSVQGSALNSTKSLEDAVTIAKANPININNNITYDDGGILKTNNTSTSKYDNTVGSNLILNEFKKKLDKIYQLGLNPNSLSGEYKQIYDFFNGNAYDKKNNSFGNNKEKNNFIIQDLKSKILNLNDENNRNTNILDKQKIKEALNNALINIEKGDLENFINSDLINNLNILLKDKTNNTKFSKSFLNLNSAFNNAKDYYQEPIFSNNNIVGKTLNTFNQHIENQNKNLNTTISSTINSTNLKRQDFLNNLASEEHKAALNLTEKISTDPQAKLTAYNDISENLKLLSTNPSSSLFSNKIYLRIPIPDTKKYINLNYNQNYTLKDFNNNTVLFENYVKAKKKFKSGLEKISEDLDKAQNRNENDNAQKNNNEQNQTFNFNGGTAFISSPASYIKKNLLHLKLDELTKDELNKKGDFEVYLNTYEDRLERLDNNNLEHFYTNKKIQNARK